MTREEHIIYAKNLRVALNMANNFSVETMESLDAAIKALEQHCEDAVSRQAVIDALDKRFDSVPMEQTTEILLLRKDLRELPPVTPTNTETVTEFADRCRECGKQKKGEWCKQNDDYFDWYECSECGYGSEGEMQYSSEYDVRTKYCPNCGAEMESEK